MSEAASLDTSTWALRGAFGPFAKRPTSGPTANRRNGAVWQFGGPPVLSSSPVPGVALGNTTPTAMRATAQRQNAFRAAFMAGLEEAREAVAADEADAPDPDIWETAITVLWPFAAVLSPPLVSPLQLGGVSCEWHEQGLNIELRFRGVRDVFAVIEDAQGKLKDFYGQDPDLFRIREALLALFGRSA